MIVHQTGGNRFKNNGIRFTIMNRTLITICLIKQKLKSFAKHRIFCLVVQCLLVRIEMNSAASSNQKITFLHPCAVLQITLEIYITEMSQRSFVGCNALGAHCSYTNDNDFHHLYYTQSCQRHPIQKRELRCVGLTERHVLAPVHAFSEVTIKLFQIARRSLLQRFGKLFGSNTSSCHSRYFK